jgi:hypothetical protein
MCYPEEIVVTHKKANVPLLNLLQKSVERLFEAHSDEKFLKFIFLFF